MWPWSAIQRAYDRGYTRGRYDEAEYVRKFANTCLEIRIYDGKPGVPTERRLRKANWGVNGSLAAWQDYIKSPHMDAVARADVNNG